MTTGIVPVGVCKVQFSSVCGNTETGTRHVSCNITQVDRNTRVDEVAPIDIPGGTPGTKCFYLELPNTDLPPEIVVQTCTGIDPVLSAVTGRYRYTAIDATTGATDPAGVGVLVEDCIDDTVCFCECSAEAVPCINRVSMTVWRRAYCFGEDGQLHPGGQYWIDHYPALEYQRTAQTDSATNGADDGESFTFYAYPNPGYTGPAGIIPLAAADNGYSACYYGFTSNVCPPGTCTGCGNCDGTDAPVPLGA